MKTPGIIFFLFILIGCKNNFPGTNQKPVEVADTLALKTAILRVDGMTCEGCENTIKKMVGKIEGVKEVHASFTDSLTTVVFDTSLVNIVVISETINNLGYKVVGEILPQKRD